MSDSDAGRASDDASATPARRVTHGDLTPESVAHLAVARGYPCISVLMPTTPAPRMRLADRERLDGLLLDVERRLADDRVVDRGRLVRELRRQARVAQESSTWNALGLFVDHSVSQAWTLAVTVHPRVVIESTFATRDLLRDLHRTPPHLVVRVDEFGARVFWVSARATLLETVERLPDSTAQVISSRGPAGGDPAAGADRAVDARRDWLARLDACMERLRAERPAPLVLAGDRALVGELKVHRTVAAPARGRGRRCRGRCAGRAVQCYLAVPGGLPAPAW